MAAITANPMVAQYQADLVLSTQAGAAIRWARAMLAPGVAVVLDTVIQPAVRLSTRIVALPAYP